MKAVSSLLFFALLASLVAKDESWPSWRGPNRNGAVAAEGPPLEFSDNENLLWKVKLPGRGCSTPVVTGGKIFVTSPVDELDGILAFDMKGKELWRTTLGEVRPGRGQRVGSSANSSPVTDGETLFSYFKSGALAAHDLDGKELWSLNVFEKYGEDKLWWDVGTSPVITSKGLVLAVMQTEGDSYVVCFDKKTGKELWKVDRKFDVEKESGDSYTTPHVVTLDGRETLVTWGADHLTGHATDDGSLLWTCGGFNPQKKAFWRVIASAVVTDGIAVVPYSRGEWIAGVKLGGSGDITDSAILWKKKLGTDAATPIAAAGKVYLLTDRGKDRGEVACLKAESGEVLWESRLPKGAQTFYSSPILAGGILYCPREDGVVFSAKVGGGGLEGVQANDTGESMIASPVMIGGTLLLRGDVHLMAFGSK